MSKGGYEGGRVSKGGYEGGRVSKGGYELVELRNDGVFERTEEFRCEARGAVCELLLVYDWLRYGSIRSWDDHRPRARVAHGQPCRMCVTRALPLFR